MGYNKCKLLASLLIITSYVAVCTAESALLNQIWWTKETKQLQRGCAGMCCSGKNSTCFGTGPKIEGGSSFGRCFCDASCLEMNDCCEDYTVECQAVDCVVGEWEDYGSCSKPCGLGTKTRQRQVIQEPRNGGKKCPVLKENTVCKGEKCKSQRHLGARGRVDFETAKIMPASFAQFRDYTNYNAHLDIRKNLYNRYYLPRSIKRKGYCATYRITSTRVACLGSSVYWSQVLRKQQEICVECQPKAMGEGFRTTCPGHGSTESDTFWTAVNSHGCHGWWRRMGELKECSCTDKKELGFIFI
ncbi:somatomedin-B and thrombospondin type-1 domain-containing protein-like [Watersipora subatra]|uniref:somatomedin-B and thrombospondin type-1 domain-containing protein-like n=1 Tax=Watersipora subatra TaxID=2589382 RepID=UPI00355C6096